MSEPEGPLPTPRSTPGPNTREPAAPAVPTWAEWLTRFLDDGLRIPGTQIRFGLDAIVGALLPGAGDAMTALGSISLLALAVRRGVPTSVLLRMLLNIAVDAAVGMFPVVGDVFDLAYKANRKNLDLLERHARGANTGIKPVDVAIVGVGLVLLATCLVLPLLVWVALFRWFGQSGQ